MGAKTIKGKIEELRRTVDFLKAQQEGYRRLAITTQDEQTRTARIGAYATVLRLIDERFEPSPH